MRITLRDIAKRVNLSHATVSFVLNGRMDVSIPATTRERVLIVAKEMGYRPNRAAQALVRGRTNMVALWLPLMDAARYAPAQHEFAKLADADGFELVTRMIDFSQGPGGAEWEMDDWPVDGLLMLDCHQPSRAAIAPTTGVPLVSLGARFDPEYDHVGLGVAVGVREAMTQLMDSGCRRIAHLTCDADSPDEPMLTAYVAECGSRRLEPEFIEAKTCSRHGAREAVRSQFSAVRVPEAILAQTDELAIAAIRGLFDSGKSVPLDVLVIGCGDSEEGEFAIPSLTSISLPIPDMCRASWEVLRRRMAESTEEDVRGIHAKILDTRLVVRESSVRAM